MARAGGEGAEQRHLQALAIEQKAVLELFASGKTDKEISIELSMAQYRVRKTVEQMLSELGLATRSQLFAAVYPSSLS